MIALRALLPRALVVVAPLAFVGASCGQLALGVMPGVLNDVHNLSLRRAILAYGTSQVCAEVQSRSMPLRLRNDDPIVGRFVPLGCSSSELDGGNLALQFNGRGFVWTNLSLRVGFEAGSSIQYDTDFLMDGSTMYVYFRPRASAGATFASKMVEQPQAAFFGGLPSGPNGQSMTDRMGSQIMTGQLSRGFTVIRASNGGVELGLGVIPPGGHPPTALTGVDQGKRVIANERTEVHQNQRDYVPLEVPAGSRLTLLVGVDGAPAIDVLLVPRAVGDAWLYTYVTQSRTTPPAAPPILDEAVVAGGVWQRTLEVPAGQYYLVLDNTDTAGRTAPPRNVRDDRAALVSYGIELD
jgi:hypothetical protein